LWLAFFARFDFLFLKHLFFFFVKPRLHFTVLVVTFFSPPAPVTGSGGRLPGPLNVALGGAW
jgi:hypothetical protein